MTTPREAAHCFALGAQRVELCHTLEVGGLTATTADLLEASTASDRPVFALVRRQAETFRLATEEVAALVQDVGRIAALGVAGVVVGVLDGRGRIDVPAMAELVSAAAGLPVTFHRAYDELDDLVGGVDLLMRAGVARVLTSGGAATAWQGRVVLRQMVQAAGEALTILGGGGVRADHVRELVGETGLREVHARASAMAGIMRALGR